MNSTSYKRGLDGESTSRDVIDTLTSNSPTKDQRESFEEGKADRARIQAEEKSREKSEK